MGSRKFSFTFYKKGDRSDILNIRKMSLSNFYNNGFVNNPSGLGLKTIIGNLRIGNRVLPGKVEDDMVPIQFEIAFLNYTKYNNFIKNLAWSNKKAVLEYEIPGVGKYKRDITFEEVTKEEVKEGYLSASVTIVPESFWYKETETVLTLTAETFGSYLYANDSEMDCEIYFLTHNRCDELIVQVNSSIETIGCKLQNLSELEYSMIRYSSEDGNAYIYNQGPYAEQFVDIKNTRYVNLDSKYIPFLKIPKFENAYVKFKSNVDNKVTLKIKSFYSSV